MSERTVIKISPGNKKLGDVPSFSLTPGKACAPACSHCLKACYDRRLLALRPSLADSRQFNTGLAKDDLPELKAQLLTWFKHQGYMRPRLFRIHIGGDFFSQAYFQVWLEVAETFPDVRFLAYSKAWDVITPSQPADLPDNFTLIFSVWPTINLDEIPPAFPRSWVQDGTETRIPADAFECPGDCQSCGFCWFMQPGQSVVFKKH